MPRYIDADKAEELLIQGYEISDVPTADVQEVIHAHWVITEYEYLNCSHCGEAYYTGAESTEQAKEWLEKGYAYSCCPYCGAKMDGKDKENG